MSGHCSIRSANQQISIFLFCVFVFFLGGAFLNLWIPDSVFAGFSLRRRLLCCGAMTAAAFLTTASYYGIILIPMLCLCQGVLVSMTAEGIVQAFHTGDCVRSAMLAIAVHIPVFFCFTHRGMVNAWALNRHETPERKECFSLTALLLMSVLCSFWSSFH